MYPCALLIKDEAPTQATVRRLIRLMMHRQAHLRLIHPLVNQHLAHLTALDLQSSDLATLAKVSDSFFNITPVKSGLWACKMVYGTKKVL